MLKFLLYLFRKHNYRLVTNEIFLSLFILDELLYCKRVRVPRPVNGWMMFFLSIVIAGLDWNVKHTLLSIRTFLDLIYDDIGRELNVWVSPWLSLVPCHILFTIKVHKLHKYGSNAWIQAPCIDSIETEALSPSLQIKLEFQRYSSLKVIFFKLTRFKIAIFNIFQTLQIEKNTD